MAARTWCVVAGTPQWWGIAREYDDQYVSGSSVFAPMFFAGVPASVHSNWIVLGDTSASANAVIVAEASKAS